MTVPVGGDIGDEVCRIQHEDFLLERHESLFLRFSRYIL